MNRMSDRFKGYFFTFISVLSVSSVYIFSKYLLNRVSLPQFGFWWFLAGGIFIVLYGLWTKSFAIYRTFGPRDYLILLVNGLLELSATYFFYKAIQTVPNPAIVSFMGNLSPVFIFILGTLILKEKFNTREIIGALITITGAFLISYKGGIRLQDMFIKGSLYILAFVTLFAINSILLKKYVRRLSPVVLTINRVIFIFGFFTVWLWLSDDSFAVPSNLWPYFVAGAFFGPFLTVISALHALKYIEVSKKSILGTTKGLFVMLGAYLVFGHFPTTLQIIGGILSMIGAIMIITARMERQKTTRWLRKNTWDKIKNNS